MNTIPRKANPFELFQEWFEKVKACKTITEPTAMVLATTGEDQFPDARVVLMKECTDAGVVFYTNLASAKGRQLDALPRAALCFYWMPLNMQVRFQGTVHPVTPEEADAYFASRPKQSQLGAWASKQSQALESRMELEKRLATTAARYGLVKVPRPDFWSGFRLVPHKIEFWLAQPFRLHDRLCYTRSPDAPGSDWNKASLFP